MKLYLIYIFVFSSYAAYGHLRNASPDFEDLRINMIVDIITINLKNNGWNIVLCCGNLPDSFYTRIQHIAYAFVVMNLEEPDKALEEVVPYYPNLIIISCLDFQQYEKCVHKLLNSPYWHPLSNIIVYYQTKEEKERIAKTFFSLWYHKAINVIVVQYDDLQEILLVSEYTPYVDEHYDLPLNNMFGCWTVKKTKVTVVGFEKELVCVEKCHNVSLFTELRANNLGTCIGFNTSVLSYNTRQYLKGLNFFEDKSKNLHGFTLRAYATEVKPFFFLKEHENETYTMHARDGILWNTISKLMNFGIDLTPGVNDNIRHFNYETTIKHLFAFVRRDGDLFLNPLYIFDLVVLELDYAYPYKESGVCVVSGRAGFERITFDKKTLEANYEFIIQFIACFICIWVTICIYKVVENGYFSFDQIGKDLMNAFRNILLLNLHKPPKQESFRIFLSISIWSFFVVNFTTQSTIISFFTVVRRGKEVETFQDIVDKGYSIEGMASPDVILPDTEENFRIVNSRLVPTQEMYGCIKRMSNDTRRFCLIDCSVGRYVEKNWLNAKGEQYLHIVQDRMHNYYLTIIFPRHSPLSNQVSKYSMIFVEAGLIKKWEQYRYSDIKDEVPTKPLGMDDLSGIFELYSFSVGFTFAIFLLELLIYYGKKLIVYFF